MGYACKLGGTSSVDTDLYLIDEKYNTDRGLGYYFYTNTQYRFNWVWERPMGNYDLEGFFGLIDTKLDTILWGISGAYFPILKRSAGYYSTSIVGRYTRDNYMVIYRLYGQVK